MSQGVIYVGEPLKAPQMVDSGRGIVPTNYVQFCELYAEPIRRQVAAFAGIGWDDVEDVVQDIIMQFIAGDYLNVYCADRQSVFAQERYQALVDKFNRGELEFMPEPILGKFSSFIFIFTLRRLQGMRDKANRRLSTMRSLDSFLGDDSDEPVSALVFAGISPGVSNNMELQEVLQKAFIFLAENTAPTDTRNFPELFTTVIDDSVEEGGFDRKRYAAQKKITISAVSMQLREMRTALEQAGFYKHLRELCFCRRQQINSVSI